MLQMQFLCNSGPLKAPVLADTAMRPAPVRILVASEVDLPGARCPATWPVHLGFRAKWPRWRVEK
jgi:hypothetical protein